MALSLSRSGCHLHFFASWRLGVNPHLQYTGGDDADDLTAKLDRLEEDGFVLIPGALSSEEVELCRTSLNKARENGWGEGANTLGNMWFDTLQDRMPEVSQILWSRTRTFSSLIGCPCSGPQCQLRPLRGHINPGLYT